MPVRVVDGGFGDVARVDVSGAEGGGWRMTGGLGLGAMGEGSMVDGMVG